MRAELTSSQDKHVNFDELKDGYHEAVARARRLNSDAAEQGEPGRNPTTLVCELTEAIRLASTT